MATLTPTPTPAQRTAAVQQLLSDPSGTATLLGLTASQLVDAVVTAVGTAFDPQLSTILANLVTVSQNQVKALNATLANANANVTAWTVS